jgi:hypothetical protein
MSNTIIIIALFIKSLKTMTSIDKTNTSRGQYSRNDFSDDDNIPTDHYKQGKQQPDVAPRGDERQE